MSILYLSGIEFAFSFFPNVHSPPLSYFKEHEPFHVGRRRAALTALSTEGFPGAQAGHEAWRKPLGGRHQSSLPRLYLKVGLAWTWTSYMLIMMTKNVAKHHKDGGSPKAVIGCVNSGLLSLSHFSLHDET